MRQQPGNDLKLGQVAGTTGTTLVLPRESRDKHLYVCGATGTGKSKFLENLIRQDIAAWSKSNCGLLLLDPHGSLYDGIVSWLAWNNLKRPVTLIDLRRDDWVVGYNVLRRRAASSSTVVVDAFIQVMAHVWGQGGTDQTPLFARWAATILQTLYEKDCTLADALHLLDPSKGPLRHALTANLADPAAALHWREADSMTSKDFHVQVSSTVNRLERFIRNQQMRLIFGQAEASLDLGNVLEEGAIVLVNLSTEGGRISDEDSDTFGSLLLTDLWTAARARGKREGVKPFYVYLDEFQNFVTPSIARSLDEARGYGLHMTVAQQFPQQLTDRGDYGRQLYNSIMENAASKVVFRLSHEDNLKPLAQLLFLGVMNPEEIKHKLYSTKVMGYREETRTITSRSHGWGTTAGTSMGDTTDGVSVDPTSAFTGESSGSSEGANEGESQVPVLVPVLDKELSHVQFRSLEEQLFRSMAVLFDQEQRHGVARLVGMKAPVAIVTPTVISPPTNRKWIERYSKRVLDKLPFALPKAEAMKRLQAREDALEQLVLGYEGQEPTTVRRRLR